MLQKTGDRANMKKQAYPYPEAFYYLCKNLTNGSRKRLEKTTWSCVFNRR